MDSSVIIYGFLTAVLLVATDGDTTTVVVCPFSDPLAHGVSCLQDGFANVEYNSIRQDPGTITHSTQSPHQKRGAPEDSVTIERGPDVPPPSTLDLSTEFVQYFCSESGGIMVNCAMEVYDKCTDHPSMDFFSFNPVQATKARELCGDIATDYSQVASCLNETATTDAFLSCAYAAYEKYSQPRYKESYVTSRCRATADAYNCYTTIGERFCGTKIIDFSVALMRVMEDRHCTPIVDQVYIAPVSAGISIASSIIPLTVVTLLILSLLHV